MSGRQRALSTSELERRAWTLYIERGRKQAEIATELGVNQASVSRAIARVEARVKDEFAAYRTKERARQLLRLDFIYAESVEAYLNSKAARTTRSQRTRTEGQGTSATPVTTDSAVRVQESVGDPRFLSAAMDALAHKRKLLGLDAPVKVQPVEPARPHEGEDDYALQEELRALLAHAGIVGVVESPIV